MVPDSSPLNYRASSFGEEYSLYQKKVPSKTEKRSGPVLEVVGGLLAQKDKDQNRRR